MAPTTTSDDELFGDDARRGILEGRLQRLHTDLYGLEINLAEEQADPHGNPRQVAQFKKDIASVKERVKVVRGILTKLPAPPAPADDAAGDAPTG
jgi:ribosomal protein L29